MKKLIAIILVLCSFASISVAESIFGDFTFDQLLILHHALDQEIMSRPEWKEVTVPAGDWIVGVDIPEGKYSIRPVKNGYIKIIDTKGNLFFSDAMSKDEIVGKLELKEGYSIRLENSFIFSPAKGLDF